jgi:hypothetical protein
MNFLTAIKSVAFACPLFPCGELEFLCMELIKVNEMLAVMEMRGEDGQLIPWSARIVKANIKKNTGGTRFTVKKVVLVGGMVSKSTVRNPEHAENFTRNFRSINNQEIREFHPPLVEEFNGMRVVL